MNNKMNNIMKLNQALKEINFLSRFGLLFKNHDGMEAAMDEPDLKIVKNMIERYDYKAVYHKGEKFFKITKEGDKNSSLYLSVRYGIAEFILNLEDKGVEYGDDFTGLSLRAGSEERIKNPYFGTYEELDEILKEGFSIYEDLKKILFGNSPL